MPTPPVDLTQPSQILSNDQALISQAATAFTALTAAQDRAKSADAAAAQADAAVAAAAAAYVVTAQAIVDYNNAVNSALTSQIAGLKPATP